MEHQQAVDLVVGILARTRAIEPSLIRPETRLVDDLGFDSLDASELLAALHKDTGRQLAVTDLSQLRTVGQVADAIVDQRAQEEVAS
jgi:acyl carrier protein